MKTYTGELLERIRNEAPLIHNITNFVVMNSSANILLALGASPVMAHSRDEVEEMTAMAGALVLNIGTLEEEWIKSMLLAARTANCKGIPVILDPVGSGATKLRTETVKRILRHARISVLRGNASEILSLGTAAARTRGVDSAHGLSETVVETANRIALKEKCIVAVSGERDLVTDGRHILRVDNGQPLMTRVTGMGCGLSAVTAAFCAVARDDLLPATAAAHACYGLCGDLASKISDRPGSFFTAFLDALYSVGRREIQAGLKVETA